MDFLDFCQNLMSWSEKEGNFGQKKPNFGQKAWDIKGDCIGPLNGPRLMPFALKDPKGSSRGVGEVTGGDWGAVARVWLAQNDVRPQGPRTSSLAALGNRESVGPESGWNRCG
mgnify:CR=1 FL=1